MSTIYRISHSQEQEGGEGRVLSLQAQNPGLDGHSAKLQVNKSPGSYSPQIPANKNTQQTLTGLGTAGWPKR